MMNLSPPTIAGMSLDPDKSKKTRVSEQKKVGGFNLTSLSSPELSFRGTQIHVHGHREMRSSNQTCFLMDEGELLMGPLLYQQSCFDLMQNCDLPPPVKVLIAGADKTGLTSSRLPPYSKKSRNDDDFPTTGDSFEVEKQESFEVQKQELLKALQLSQTRAREAERKATVITAERDRLSNSLLKESLRLFSYRQWMKLLEVEVSQLQSHNQKQHQSHNQKQHQLSDCDCARQPEREQKSSEKKKPSSNGDVGTLRWCMALALCVGIAGVGIAFGCRYHLF